MDIQTHLLKSYSENMRMVKNYAILIVFSFFLIGCALSNSFSANKVTDTGPVIIEGVYDCTGSDYKGSAVIRQKGDVYQIRWRINKQIFYGIGIREDNILSSSWFDKKGAVGVVVYKIEPGPILKGRYSIFSSDGSIKEETLTFKRGLNPSDNASENRLET